MTLGDKFGRLTVLALISGSKTRQSSALVICECGTKRQVQRYNLAHGHTRSCGCLKHEVMVKRALTVTTSRAIADGRRGKSKITISADKRLRSAIEDAKEPGEED